jgi:hypothetical protein
LSRRTSRRSGSARSSCSCIERRSSPRRGGGSS